VVLRPAKLERWPVPIRMFVAANGAQKCRRLRQLVMPGFSARLIVGEAAPARSLRKLISLLQIYPAFSI